MQKKKQKGRIRDRGILVGGKTKGGSYGNGRRSEEMGREKSRGMPGSMLLFRKKGQEGGKRQVIPWHPGRKDMIGKDSNFL